jgi:flagellar basal-body rod modification protein FlgD
MPTIPPTTGSPATTGAASQNRAFMGKEDFLQLLVAQLKNQDPSNAQDLEGMTQQMTQFSILEQLSNISKATEKAGVVEMLGKTATYRRADGSLATGVVEHVDVSGKAPMLTVGGVAGIDPANVTSLA